MGRGGPRPTQVEPVRTLVGVKVAAVDQDVAPLPQRLARGTDALLARAKDVLGDAGPALPAAAAAVSAAAVCEEQLRKGALTRAGHTNHDHEQAWHSR